MYPTASNKSVVLWFLCSIVLMGTACGSAAPATATPAPGPTLTPAPTQTAEPTLTLTPASTPLPEIDLAIELPEGDPEAGYTRAIRYTCYGCHVNELHLTSGPRFAATAELPFVLDRGEMRIALPDYEGQATTNLEYMIESTFLPEVYIVPGDWKEPMPTYFRDLMTDQELADILAWIATFR